MVHNVETLSNLPYIINNGTEWYQSLGAVYKDTPRGVDPMNTGTKLYCVSGHVEKPGVYEVEMGLTVRELVELAGGVRGGNEVKAVIPGGSSAPVLTPYELDVPVDFTCLQMAKTSARLRRHYRHGRNNLHGARAGEPDGFLRA